VLHEGTLKELLGKLDPNNFQSTIYAKHGLPKLEDNIAEGYVIKPDIAMKDSHGNRMSIKVKSIKCLEGPVPGAAKAAPPAPKKQADLTPEQAEVLHKAVSYVNKNRMENLWSKLTDSEKVEKSVVSALMADAIKDFQKTEAKEIVEISNKIKPQLMPALKDECTKLFKEFSEQGI
jgi:lipopolysaccharide biosynthesis regulator YciM